MITEITQTIIEAVQDAQNLYEASWDGDRYSRSFENCVTETFKLAGLGPLTRPFYLAMDAWGNDVQDWCEEYGNV